MDKTLKAQFDAGAKNYDEQRKSLIPCFDDFYGAAVAWTETSAERPRIMDVGAGTGLLASMVLKKYPNAELTLIDFSEDMLAQARARFADRGDFVYVNADYMTYPFEAASFDAVVSSLSIHHLPHGDKKQLFGTIRKLLKPGGVFVNADQSAGATDAFDIEYRRQWDQAVEASGLEYSLIEASRERRSYDMNAGLPEQLKWLQEAGFASADCVYKYNEFTVYVAKV
ncbi:class I SAM-dependent methyltransferase [Paenibacillus sp. GCM10027627]|uniref:class I SAM-dependent methyltransferase n=1 Tax=unclassified Paenibacillus TaxID=185978 RepID=UPI003625AADF